MIFRQFIDDDLFCASYLLGDGGEAVVVDPGWDIDRYLDAARAQQLQIKHVVETHVHADHVSGRTCLAEVTGARSYVPAGGGAEPPQLSLKAGLAPAEHLAMGRCQLHQDVLGAGVPRHIGKRFLRDAEQVSLGFIGQAAWVV